MNREIETMKVNEAKNTLAEAQDRKAEQGFTPGPWKVTVTYWGRDTWEPEDAPRRVFAYNVQSTRPYDGESPTFFVDGIHHEPNALLVAASPALYEALRNLLNCKWVSGTTSTRVEEARAALALVDGRTSKK